MHAENVQRLVLVKYPPFESGYVAAACGLLGVGEVGEGLRRRVGGSAGWIRGGMVYTHLRDLGEGFLSAVDGDRLLNVAVERPACARAEHRSQPSVEAIRPRQGARSVYSLITHLSGRPSRG